MNSLKSSLGPLAAVRFCTTLISLLLLLMTLELQKSLQNLPPPHAFQRDSWGTRTCNL